MKNFFAAIFILGAVAAQAQDNYLYLSLDINKPMSNTSWVDEVSARGFRGGYRAFITDRISAGIDASATTFDRYVPRETRQSGSGAITTDYFNYAYSYSVAASVQYNFDMGEEQDIFFPYAGVGLGAMNIEFVEYYNLYTNSERGWGFLVRPEVGAVVKFGARRGIGAIVAVHYDYSTNESEAFNYGNFSAVGINIGLIFYSRY